MTSIDIQLDGDNCWPDLKDRDVAIGELKGIALLPDAVVVDTFTGLQRRVPAVTLRLELHGPAAPTVLVQLKVETLEMLARAMRGRLEYLADLKKRGGRSS